jgi:hypothetical protein
MTTDYRCPKCRNLGLSTDCSERLTHARKGNTVRELDDDNFEMEVTLRFAVPVAYTSADDPHRQAQVMREGWVEEPDQLVTFIAEALADDFDLTVVPVEYG